MAMSSETTSNIFIFPITNQGYWQTTSLSGHCLPLRAHPVGIRAIVKLFNEILPLWP